MFGSVFATIAFQCIRAFSFIELFVIRIHNRLFKHISWTAPTDHVLTDYSMLIHETAGGLRVYNNHLLKDDACEVSMSSKECISIKVTVFLKHREMEYTIKLCSKTKDNPYSYYIAGNCLDFAFFRYFLLRHNHVYVPETCKLSVTLFDDMATIIVLNANSNATYTIC